MQFILGDLTVTDNNRKFGSSTEVSDHLWYLHMSSLLECPFYASCKTYIQVKSRDTANNISYNSSLIDCLIYDHLMWWQFCWRMMALLQNKLYNSWLLQLIRLVNLKQWWYIMKQRIIGIVMTASVTSWRHCASFQNLIFRRQANCRLRIKPYGTFMHTYMYVTQSIKGNAWSWMYIILRKRMKCLITLCSRAK